MIARALAPLLLVSNARAAAFCSSAPRVRLSLFFERDVRKLLKGGQRRTEELQLPSTERPLTALRQVLQAKLSGGLPALQLQHGKRPIETEAELAELLSTTASLGVSPQLRVAARVGAALPSVAPAAPAAPAAPPPPSGPLQMVSFYDFYPARLDAGRLPLLELAVHSALRELGVLGTVNLAPEGINAQLAVPLGSTPMLGASLGRIRELRGVAARLNLGEVVSADEAADGLPFLKLSVKARPQVLTDGLDAPLDWSRAGRSVPPSEWDEAISTPGALLLDCRNDFESDAGRFAGAEPLGTRTFSGSWAALRARLQGVPKDTPILTYCTGGIRCVKVNAFLEQSLGYINTAKLKDGVVGYHAHLRERPDATSSWRGANFVFDRRAPVTPPRQDD